MIRLQRREGGPYFAAFSLHIPDMRVEIVKICPRSPIVSIEPVFRFRTPKSDRLLGFDQLCAVPAMIRAQQAKPDIVHQAGENRFFITTRLHWHRCAL